MAKTHRKLNWRTKFNGTCYLQINLKNIALQSDPLKSFSQYDSANFHSVFIYLLMRALKDPYDVLRTTKQMILQTIKRTIELQKKFLVEPMKVFRDKLLSRLENGQMNIEKDHLGYTHQSFKYFFEMLIEIEPNLLQENGNIILKK